MIHRDVSAVQQPDASAGSHQHTLNIAAVFDGYVFARPGSPMHLLSVVQSFWAGAPWGSRRSKLFDVPLARALPCQWFLSLGARDRRLGYCERCAFSSFADAARQTGSAAVLFSIAGTVVRSCWSF